MMGHTLERSAGALAIFLWLCAAAQPALSGEDAEIVNPFGGREDAVEAGRTLFNVHCSHCHGPNAVQGEKPRDLRRLALRYGKNMPAIFFKTATGGREDKGMPSWAGALDAETLWTIFTFIQTVQNKK